MFHRLALNQRPPRDVSKLTYRVELTLLGMCMILTLASCSREPETPVIVHPVLEANTIHFMNSPVDRAHENVRKARDAISRADPDLENASHALHTAERELADLRWFYLPVTEARGLLLNALREDMVGHTSQRDADVARAREKLVEVAERGGDQVRRAVEEILEELADVEIRSGSQQQLGEPLDRVGRSVQTLLVKAGLVLSENEYRESVSRE